VVVAGSSGRDITTLDSRIDELREWLDNNRPVQLPAALDQRFPILLEWQRRLHAAGWLGYGWPLEYGGAGGTVLDRIAFNRELVRARAPQPIGLIGLDVVGPTLLAHASDEQRRRFIPPMLRGDELWCQGFSEPDAGSDLASLRTRADQVDGGFEVTGRKVWTSWAQYSRWCAVLARTNATAAKHKGISYLMVDMTSSGVSVLPLRQMTGDAEFNEVLFDHVFVPQENLIGALDGGWKMALDTLAHERGPYSARRQVEISVAFDEMLDNIRRLISAGLLVDDAVLRQRVGHIWAMLRVLEANSGETTRQLLDQRPGAEGSIGKLYLSVVEKAVFALGFDVLGPVRGTSEDLVPGMDSDRWTRDYLYSRASSIYGGTAEIQRSIVAQRVLGLPRE
jgi:alkylation response protein AidB-like acyl-CoA dehydrogenase